MDKRIIDFVNKVKKFSNVLQIILFGSYARGQTIKSSDIDIAIIYNKKNKATEKKINKFASKKMQITHLGFNELEKEDLLSAVFSGDGILLYGRPIQLQAKKINLIPKILLIYDLSKLNKKNKMKVYRTIHGTTSKYKYKGKKYVSKSHGFIMEKGIEKLADSVLLVSREKMSKIIRFFKLNKVKYKQIPIWMY